MRTFKRLCTEDTTLEDGDRELELKRGKEYITTPEKDGTVTVFSQYWAHGVPVELFVAEKVFTEQ